MPDDPELLTIGDFARAVGLPASALRYYDECGLLVPARTDAATGYRYYTPALEHRARLVARLREVGVPIESMRRVLDGGAGEAREVLDALVVDREQHAQQTRRALETVLSALAAQREPNEVRLRVDGPALVAALRQVRAAADSDKTSALASVALDVRGEQLDVLATNRHWMARRTLPVTADSRLDARAVLRLPVVAGLVDRLDPAGMIGASLRAGGLVLDLDDGPLEVETSELPFPSYRLVLEALDAPTCRVVVARDDLVHAVEQARRSVVVLDLDAGLHVAGIAVDAVVRGAHLVVGFRSALLLRAVGACVGDRVVLAASAPDRPVSLSSPDQQGFAALVMPTLEQP